ncbi:UDP-N-acetylmuramoyl-L-alanine--D-glutamate ligase [Sporosarcina aquimarina]|uniref:UDP-N-acetylmuramoylalanine--D-glutamate ligase n=1 Tax=Sporosarcina aquimarina TaxID=114975 RepID=A0ABU4FZ28_9BACL|nr:UDP-N-acetylmuramoyl-L-alanine--D-glutamate ligase [Sporosarcina aquimarina]MDW0109313.1 UDP-N-acetylmuramoyl-L-alanine--D-glutamate ligase [Sporosarcina aquimarina]
MKNGTQFAGKKALVLGLAKSGHAAATLLSDCGAVVTLNDFAPEDNNPLVAELRDKGVTVICGGHPDTILHEGFDFIVKNPGIPYSNPVIIQAEQLGVPIWTEIELAYLISDAPIIAITGSNGKTTTTTLLYHMLNIGNLHPLIAGNIGTVASTVARHATKEEAIVLEASSFQLMGVDAFRPHIAIWTNLYEAHLDYHGSAEAYAEAKAQVTKNQTATDFLIFNADQPEIQRYISETNATLVPFTTKGRSVQGISADELSIYWLGEPIISRKKITLPGAHNLENILSATAAALLYGCERSAIESVLSSFTGVRHRMQFVKEFNGRKFYNDSKATNTLATKSALSSFETPTILIAGGLDRGHSFEELRPHMNNVKAVIGIGETGDRFVQFAYSCGVRVAKEAGTLPEAMKEAYAVSEKGDTVLLSPACASWDQYPNFEARGDEFIGAVQQLKI